MLVLTHCHLFIYRYSGPSQFNSENKHSFLLFPCDSEEADCLYDGLIEIAQNVKSVEALLLQCLSNDYLSMTDYITRKPSTAWFLEFEIVTLVSSQADKLHYLCGKQNISEEHFKEANVIAEMKSGVLITRKQFPHLHEWFAIHVLFQYTLP